MPRRPNVISNDDETRDWTMRIKNICNRDRRAVALIADKLGIDGGELIRDYIVAGLQRDAKRRKLPV